MQIKVNGADQKKRKKKYSQVTWSLLNSVVTGLHLSLIFQEAKHTRSQAIKIRRRLFTISFGHIFWDVFFFFCFRENIILCILRYFITEE